MKGPGLRIDIDVRRTWRCPVCGQSQKLPLNITSARCGCVRDGVPMKLIEGLRAERRVLRPEVRSIIDRLQAGEVFPRMVSLVSSESDVGPREENGPGGSRTRPRTERADRFGRRPQNESRYEPQPEATPAASAAPSASPSLAAPVSPMPSPSLPSQDVPDDEFGAGLGDGHPSATSID